MTDKPPGYREGPPLTVGSLFSGIGGIELGLEWTGGFKTVWQVENDKYATRVLERHWPGVRRWDDVRTFPPDADSTAGRGRAEQGQSGDGQLALRGEDWHVDLICGGFPCQDISYAGKGAGLGGERSGLFYEAARIIRTLGPRYVVLENVSALLTRGIGDVLGTLVSLGYDCEWTCLPAAAVGAPHIRDRVFVIAYTAGTRHATARGQQGDQQQRANPESHGQRRSGDIGDDGSEGNVADTRCQLPQERRDGDGDGRRGAAIEPCGCTWEWWATEPNMGYLANELPADVAARLPGGNAWRDTPIPRVATGIPNRVNKLRCLGNAVVPAVAYWIGQRILAMEARNDST